MRIGPDEMHAMRLRNLLLILLLAGSAPVMAHTLLVLNVNGYTLDSAGEVQRFEAMLVKDGKVLATGAADHLLTMTELDAIHDGQGNTLLPGLIDAHGHVMGLGQGLREVDLSGTRTLDEALERVRAWAQAHPELPWISGRGWNQVIWKLDRFPTAAELDQAVADRPVWLRRVDGHAGWANSLALAQTGIGPDTPDPVGGRIEHDARGKPTGILVDGAMDLVESRMPEASAEELQAQLHAALADMARVGLTGVHDAGVSARTVALYRQQADAGQLTARIYAMILGTEKDFDQLAVDGPFGGYGQDRLSVRAVKMLVDGALGSRGAALHAPYSDDPGNYGLTYYDLDAMVAAITKALSRGYQVGIHAIGDRGNREVLDAYSIAYQKLGHGRELRNRIEHAQIVSLEDIPRFLPLQLTASMQPTHATSDMNMAEDRVGPQRIQGAYAWQRFLAQGTPVAGGSEFPVESPNPFYGLHAAVTRQDHDDQPPEGWYPQQALTRAQALHAFTLGAAWAAHQETTLGTLEPGKWADFILIDQDYFEVAPTEIWKTRVLETWVGGERVFVLEP